MQPAVPQRRNLGVLAGVWTRESRSAKPNLQLKVLPASVWWYCPMSSCYWNSSSKTASCMSTGHAAGRNWRLLLVVQGVNPVTWSQPWLSIGCQLAQLGLDNHGKVSLTERNSSITRPVKSIQRMVRPHFHFRSEIWYWSENFVSLGNEKKTWFLMIHFDAKHQKSEAKMKVK